MFIVTLFIIEEYTCVYQLDIYYKMLAFSPNVIIYNTRSKSTKLHINRQILSFFEGKKNNMYSMIPFI